MDKYYKISPCGLSLKRLPALSVTLGLELVGGLIIDKLHQVIKIYTLISSFMPAISALSGNLGLQASSNAIRGLGTGKNINQVNTNWLWIITGTLQYHSLGHISSSHYTSNIYKEIKSGLVTATLLSLVLSCIAVVWSYSDKDNVKIIKE